MKVVSNSSPLMALVVIGQLSLLQHKFGEIVVPDAVWQECTVAGRHKRGAKTIQQAEWIRVVSVQNRLLARALEKDIDVGESEAIVLTIEQHADLLLLDDNFARTIAVNMGVTIIGTVGILIWAKQSGLIPSLQDELQKLTDQAKFRMGPDLINRALAVVGESHL